MLSLLELKSPIFLPYVSIREKRHEGRYFADKRSATSVQYNKRKRFFYDQCPQIVASSGKIPS